MVRSLSITLLQILRRACLSKNFENWSIFGEVMTKTRWCIVSHCSYLSRYSVKCLFKVHKSIVEFLISVPLYFFMFSLITLVPFARKVSHLNVSNQGAEMGKVMTLNCIFCLTSLPLFNFCLLSSHFCGVKQ